MITEIGLTGYNVIAFAVFLVAAGFIAYGLGWAASKGWHKGKREFVDRMISDSCSKER